MKYGLLNFKIVNSEQSHKLTKNKLTKNKLTKLTNLIETYFVISRIINN